MDKRSKSAKPEKKNRVNSQPATPAPRNVLSRAAVHAPAASPAQEDKLARQKTILAGVMTKLQQETLTLKLVVAGRKKSDDKKKEKPESSSRTIMRLTIESMKKDLRLGNTKLVISVVGGGSQFVSHPRHKAFKRNLIISALNTDALIFAEGECSDEMMKCVKESLQDFGLLDTEQVTAIRMVPKGILQLGDEDAILEVNGEVEDINSVSFRLGMQYKIADVLKAKMVLLLVGEDPEMVPAVKKAASLQIPVIVIQGFGGLVDCLSSKMKTTKESRKGEPSDQGRRGNQASKTGTDIEHKVPSKEEAKKYESDCIEIMKYFTEGKSSLINVCELPRGRRQLRPFVQYNSESTLLRKRQQRKRKFGNIMAYL
ncbi:uncharacterized protein LOC112557568 [Pomacea canaliculata]|uniref:uncharacterized protein LOC112557568 n=1 Tax=Pomacea canaliculata TaxID=400727 RepID=UPI000D729EDF|nr:uncharacterized protein LOC112557568 [Pomacea canaliculata]